jgi:hypothetical protein
MPNGEKANFVARNEKTIQSDVNRVSIGNNQLAQFASRRGPTKGCAVRLLTADRIASTALNAASGFLSRNNWPCRGLVERQPVHPGVYILCAS